jgi:hypothetical protein
MIKYKIIRFYQDSKKVSKVIKRNLTLKEAQTWCKREDTHKVGVWFDGYQKQ